MKSKIHNTTDSQILKISLNRKDLVLLDRYARLNDMTKKTAAKKILKDFLAANVSEPEDVSKSQLDLFSSRETDLFDFTN
ncbi:MAG: hypothetical protein IJ681_08415 [Bacteroidales bacterium]|nr:hypothetical protein [Bacteroidales bacterium]